MFDLYMVFLLSAEVCKVTLEERSYTRALARPYPYH